MLQRIKNAFDCDSSYSIIQRSKAFLVENILYESEVWRRSTSHEIGLESDNSRRLLMAAAAAIQVLQRIRRILGITSPTWTATTAAHSVVSEEGPIDQRSVGDALLPDRKGAPWDYIKGSLVGARGGK